MISVFKVPENLPHRYYLQLFCSNWNLYKVYNIYLVDMYSKISFHLHAAVGEEKVSLRFF